MVRRSAIALALWLVPFAHPVLACKCLSVLQPCGQTSASDVVFIGTVESIEPIFLSRWNTASAASLESLNEAYIDARQHPSDASIGRLKNAYRKAFPDLAGDMEDRLRSAKTASGVASLFYSGLGRGMQVRFKVKTLFKDEDDDDKDHKKDSGKAEEDAIELSTPFGDCGFDFQAGETYLVYGNYDEGSANSLSTDICTRTRRLSEAGEDLSFLFFYKDQPDASTRLEGFATTDELYRMTFDRVHDPENIRAPAAGAIVELESAGLTRFAETDSKGRFVFDGLREGDYKLSAYAAGYPVNARLLAGPQAFRVEAKSCPVQVLLLPKERGNP
jgi:hypothetical protein